MNRYRWATLGDVNAFFGLMLDNVANMALTVSLLAGVFKFPAHFVLTHMIPGTALGVLCGDLLLTWLAFRLARRTGRGDVTAMPLGLDTPSTFGMIFFVLGPSYASAVAAGASPDDAARLAWHIGIWAMVLSGVFKLICAVFSGLIRRVLPRAGLLGSLAAIALVIISFMPLLDILAIPVVGLLSLVIVLVSLTARIELPFKIPGALAALVVGSVAYYTLQLAGAIGPDSEPAMQAAWLPTEWMEAWGFGWTASFQESLRYLPIVIPFALGTVVGGIDCVESAIAAGDEYHTGQVIAVEAVATFIAGFSGGVIQTTPYIGHPAYKAMGGRAAYTLATALFIGSAGMIGYFGVMHAVIPKATIFPMLVFVGLEITAQSFHATDKRHYPAVALACVPALAYLALIFADGVLAQSGKPLEAYAPPVPAQMHTLRILSNGFIITSLLWSSALASMIDRKLARAGAYFAIAGIASLFGIIHSPLVGSPLIVPWKHLELPIAARDQSPWMLFAAYLCVAALLVSWGLYRRRFQPEANALEVAPHGAH